VADQLERLKAALGGRYLVERELGSGGMATVYLAEDLKHHRKVAVKVLRPELAASLGVERFVREIEIAANLTHPHILPLHDSGEADGFLYYVMPFIEGESLRERLDREGKLDVRETIRLTDQVASALSHAHERGVVHRDIKPENILLAGDQAIVADFGIARAVEVAGGERLTGTGIAVGTPAYMSPEQAYGSEEVDARSDVYALGCVVYEMVVGRAPFDGETPQALLAKHAVDTVPSLRTSDPSVPLFVERAVERALAKSPDERFQSVSAFAEALTSEMVVARVGKRRWRMPVIAAAIGVIIVAAWVFSIILGGPEYERLAVLPPANLMNDPEQEYFVQGVHNALISELQRAGVAVIARTSVVRYRNTEKTISEIASELNADAIIEASVFRAGDSVELVVRIVDGVTEEYVAAPMVRSGEFRDLMAMYRQLTGAIAEEIDAALNPQAVARLAGAQSVDPEAYEAYLKATFHRDLLSAQDLETALQYYELALQHDSVYALAYAGIAIVWGSRQQMGIVAPSEAGPNARAAVDRALELDSTLAEVQHASAVVKTWVDWDWVGAEEAFERTIEIDANYPSVRASYSHFLNIMGRAEEAMLQVERGLELDPFDVMGQMFSGWSLMFLDRYDEAIALFQNAPNHPLAYIGLRSALHGKGMYEETLAVTKERAFPEVAEALDRGYAEGGYHQAMLRAAEALTARSRTTYVQPTRIAQLYAVGGEHDQAFEWLGRSLEIREPNMPYLNAIPEYDGLHEDPRWRDLLSKMGLPH
jgi:TolB-like protein/tRNA A-37 threonylcarbamoyl transferase component Bud32